MARGTESVRAPPGLSGGRGSVSHVFPKPLGRRKAGCRGGDGQGSPLSSRGRLWERRGRGRDGTDGGEEGKAGVPPERSHVSLNWLRAGWGWHRVWVGLREEVVHSFNRHPLSTVRPGSWPIGLGRPSPPVHLFSSNLGNQLTIPPKIPSSHTLTAPFIRGSPGAGYRLRISH